MYAYGSVPPAVLQRFARRRAFFFILEALAQCLPLWANISDALSRRDFAYTGPEVAPPGFSLHRVYTLLADFVDSGSFDVEPLVRDIVKNLSTQRLSLGL